MHDKFFYFFNPQPELTIPPIYPDTNISRINVPDTVLKAIPGTPGDTDSIKEILLIETKAGSHQDSIKKEITVDKDTSFSAAGDSIFQGADSSDINFNITIDPDSFIYIFKAEEIIFSPESLFTHIPALPKELKKEKTLPTDSIKTHKQIAEKKIITRLESDNSQYQTEKKLESSDWMLGIFLFSLIIVAWLKIFYNKYFTDIFKSVYSYQTSYKMFEAKNALLNRVSFIANLFSCIVFSFLIFLILEYYDITFFDLTAIMKFIAITGIIILIYSGKFLVYKIIGFTFLAQDIVSEYLHNVFSLFKVQSFIILPLVISIPYIPNYLTVPFIYACIIAIAVFFLIRIFRGIQIGLKISLSFFYLILYLCVLEILPVLIFYKFFCTLHIIDN